MASESGSSTDSHAETPENKDGESLLSVISISPKYGFTWSSWEYLLTKMSRILLFPSTVKKKCGAGLKFSNLMNIGKKKPSSLESQEKCVDTSGEQRSTVHVVPDYKIPKHVLIVPQVQFLSFDTVHFLVFIPAGAIWWRWKTKHVNIFPYVAFRLKKIVIRHSYKKPMRSSALYI